MSYNLARIQTATGHVERIEIYASDFWGAMRIANKNRDKRQEKTSYPCRIVEVTNSKNPRYGEET